MAINLKKGQSISLEKESPGLQKVMCGLGWDVAKRPKGLFGVLSYAPNYDLDASVICLDANGRLSSNKDVIYFGNLRHKSGSIVHLGDNLTGAGEGDDEQITVDLQQIPPEIARLVFTVNIYSCLARGQDFSQINNAFVRLVDLSKTREIARYKLSGEQYQGMTGMIMAEIARQDGQWHLKAVGEGVRVKNLEELVSNYS